MPYLIEHLSASIAAAIWTCVLFLGAAGVLLFLGYRSKQEDGGDTGLKTLFEGAIPDVPAIVEGSPSLGILWQPEEKPYLHEYRMPNDPSQTLHSHFRVCVVNLSKKEQARDVEVILEELSPRRLDCVPCHLRLMNNILPGETPIEKFSLNPEGKQPIDVMMWRPDSSRFQIWHTVLRQQTDVPAQPYTMKITASAANASPVTETFEIFKDGAAWNMRLLDKPLAKERPWPHLKLTGLSMPPIGQEDGIWKRRIGQNSNLSWLAMFHNGSLDDQRDIGSAWVRAQIVYRPNRDEAYVIAPIAWLGHKEDTIEIKAGTPAELIVAVEVFITHNWRFVTPDEYWAYNELYWHQGDCELEVRLIDGNTGRVMNPTYVLQWTWATEDRRPAIRLLRKGESGGN